MQSFSEIECALLLRDNPASHFFNACKHIASYGFELDIESPGYMYDGNFEYPTWRTLEQANEEIIVSHPKQFGINLASLTHTNKSFGRMCIEADIDKKCLALKIGEETVLEKSGDKLEKEKLISFVKLCDSLAKNLDVDAWKIAQTGFEYDRDSFCKYDPNETYPASSLNSLISWYEKDYLERW